MTAIATEPVPLSKRQKQDLIRGITSHARYVADDVSLHTASEEPIEKLAEDCYEQRVYLYDADLLWNDLTRIAKRVIWDTSENYYYDVGEAMNLLTSTVSNLLGDDWTFYYEDEEVYIRRRWSSIEELQQMGLGDLVDMTYEEEPV